MAKAKDPAVLWYWNDWIGGTVTLSRFLKGCYMDLLGAQFNSGPLSLDEVKTVLGSDFGQAWPTLQKKFKVDERGNYYNEKLVTESLKRSEFSKKQKERIDKRWNGSGNTNKENEIENVDEIEKEIRGAGGKRFVKPTVSEIQAYCNERGNTIDAERFFNHYESNGWKVGKSPMKDWKASVRTWEQNEFNYKQNGTSKTKQHASEIAVSNKNLAARSAEFLQRASSKDI